MNLEDALGLYEESDEEKAARVLHQMAAAHPERSMPEGWKEAVRTTLGIERLGKARLQAVLDAGKALKLFDLRSGPKGPYIHLLAEPERRTTTSERGPKKPLSDEHRAAVAVFEGITASPSKDHIDDWKDQIREVLGVKRLRRSRIKGVLGEAARLGLFEVQGSKIVLLREPEPEAEPEETKQTPVKPAGPAPVSVPLTPPASSAAGEERPPLACGHPHWQTIPKPEEECSPGELERLKDKRHVQPRKTILIEDVENCAYCKLGIRPDYQRQRGEYRSPVPERLRRSKDRNDPGYPGWPGLCCDDGGLYVGGVANNCVYEHRRNPKHPLCTYHREHAR